MQNTATTSGPVEKRPDPPVQAPIVDSVIRNRPTEEITGLGDMQRRRLEERNLFPKRFKLNPDGGPRGSYGYSLNEVLEWVQERKASRAMTAT